MQPPPGLDPRPILELAGLLLSEQPPQAPDLKDYEPAYPDWYDPADYPKPDLATIETTAQADHGDFGAFRSRLRDDLAYFHPGDPDANGVWDGHQDGIDQRFYSTDIQDEVNAVASQLGAIEASFEIPYQTSPERTATQKAEDVCYGLRSHEIRRHSIGGRGDLGRDEVLTALLTGRLFCRVLPNLKNPSCPVQFELLDPATCAPLFEGGRGLVRFTRYLEAEIGDIIGDLNLDQAVAKKLLASGIKGEDGRIVRELSPRDRIPLAEYWDRRWCGYSANGVLLKVVEHKLGFVPFAAQLGSLGDPSVISTGGMATGVGRDENGVIVDAVPAALNPWTDPAKGTSYFHYRRFAHLQKERIAALLMDLIYRAKDPVWMRFLDDFAAKNGTPDIGGLAPGDQIELLMNHEKLEPLLAQLPNGIFGPLMATMAQDDLTGRLPMQAYGVNTAANVSGAALEGLSEQGRDKLEPWLRMLELYQGQKYALALKILHRMGPLIGNDKAGYGMVQMGLPKFRRRQALRQQPGMPPPSPFFTLSQADLDLLVDDEGEIDIRAHYTKVKLSNLPAAASAGGMLVSAGMKPKRWVMSELLDDRDPDATLAEIEEEQTRSDQTIQKIVRQKALYDLRSPYAELYYDQEFAQQTGQGEGGGAPSGPGQPGGGTGPNGLPLPATTNGISLPQLGAPPGLAGALVGRPPNMTPFPPNMTPANLPPPGGSRTPTSIDLPPLPPGR